VAKLLCCYFIEGYKTLKGKANVDRHDRGNDRSLDWSCLGDLPFLGYRTSMAFNNMVSFSGVVKHFGEKTDATSKTTFF
jgi:hypothetical protein